MKVFIGSSKEAYEELREVASWIEELDIEPVAWDEPTLFLPGENTFLKLIEITKQVDAAIFIFGEDDDVWYRADGLKQPRDNVLIEYGLFAGTLGPKRAIICRKGKPKTATDLLGLTSIDIDPNKKQGARLRLRAWAQNLGKQTDDPAVTELLLQREVLRREKEELNERLTFEQQKSRDLGQLLKQSANIDVTSYDFTTDSQWTLLFDYDYFWGAVKVFAGRFRTISDWEAYLTRTSIYHGVHLHQYDIRRGIAKTLRYMRFYNEPNSYKKLLHSLDALTQSQIKTLVERRVPSLQLARKADDEGL